LALVLLDLIDPSRSNAGFGSRRGRLSPSHDRIRSETRNKPAHRRGDLLCVLRVLGSHQFSSGQPLRVILCSGKRTYFTILAAPFFSASRYNLSWGNLARTYIVCEKAQRCRRRLFARSLFRRAPTLSLCGLYRGHRGGDLCLCRTIMPRPLHIPSGP
jgi:hypothetical protein